MTEGPVESRFEGSTLVVETAGGTETYDAQFLVAALLVFVAKGDGTISEMETQKMLALIEEHFELRSAESLALLTRAMTTLAENPGLSKLLRQLSTVLSVDEKVDIAVMLLKVVAADGRKDAEEMEHLRFAAEIVDITPDILHQAFDRYFAETMT
ncbi:MAG: TerB family tellurite resistance protein [Woeseiaceae bacterium]